MQVNEKKLSIVVPVYCNELSLPGLFQQLMALEKELSVYHVVLELIFVDDGSKDNSWQLLLEYKKSLNNLKLVKLTRNFGAVHCSKTGFQFVTGDAFMILAADLQDPPELIIEMVKAWLNGSKFVICERVKRDDPLTSRFFSKIYYLLVRRLIIKNYPEGGYDMGLMDKAFLPHMLSSSKTIFTPLLAYWLGYKPTVIPYVRNKRLHGKSGWTFSRKINAFLDVVFSFSVVPIRIISGVGVLVSLCSFIYALKILFYGMFHQFPVQGFATVVTLTTFLLGLIILMLGIIGEYLWRISEETNKRPETVIDEVH